MLGQRRRLAYLWVEAGVALALAGVCAVFAAREGSWMFAALCGLMLLSAFLSLGLAWNRRKQNRLVG